MKLKFKLLFILLIAVFLSGCKKPKPEVIEEKAYLFIDKEMDINLPSILNMDKIVWEYTNQNIIYFESATKIVGFDEGLCVIKANDGNFEYILTVEVIDETKFTKEMYCLIDIIIDEVKIIDDELNLVYSVDGYDFEITYVSTKPDILTVDGIFSRDLFDQYVNFRASLIYKNITKEFIIPIKIDMVAYEEQQKVISDFINENVIGTIDNEEGKLPTYLETYDLHITWQSNYPGIIDSANNLHKAYEATDVTLYALYKIAGKDESMNFKYRSKGINEEDKSEYINRVLTDLIPSEATKWLNVIYDQDVVIIKDYIYPDSVTRLRPGTGKDGVKMPGGPQYVVIHDTGMTGSGDNADGLNKFIHNNADTVGGRVASWHFSIDQEKAYQHVPTDEIAWHAGDGSTKFGSTYINSTSKIECIGGGNQNGIGIETCINPGNDYLLTLKRTAKLTASLLHQYGLGLDRIKQHFNFSGKQCPNVIRTSLGMWDTFLKDVEIAYFLMMIDNDYQVSWESSHPEIIEKSGLVSTPINDVLVNLKLTLTLNNNEEVYNYTTLVKGLSTEAKLTNVYYDLFLNQIPRVTNTDIVLPTINEEYNAIISWTSNKADVLNDDGKINKPINSEEVILTVKIIIDKEELVRTINVRVE